jgi:hypothetical protein
VNRGAGRLGQSAWIPRASKMASPSPCGALPLRVYEPMWAPCDLDLHEVDAAGVRGERPVPAELVLLLGPGMWERSGKATDGQVSRDVTVDDAFDDERGQEGKRRESRSIP